LLQLKGEDGDLIPHLRNTTNLVCLLEPTHWVRIFYMLKTRLSRDMQEPEFRQFCLEVIQYAKQFAPADSSGEGETGGDGQNSGRTDSETQRTLQALKEDWLLQQELQR
jgi:hypothetical protein